MFVLISETSTKWPFVLKLHFLFCLCEDTVSRLYVYHTICRLSFTERVSFVSDSGGRNDLCDLWICVANVDITPSHSTWHVALFNIFIKKESKWLHTVDFVLEHYYQRYFYCIWQLSVHSSITVIYSKRERILSSVKTETLNKHCLASSFWPHSNLEHDSSPSFDVLTLFPTTSHQEDHFIVTATQAWAVISDPSLSLS